MSGSVISGVVSQGITISASAHSGTYLSPLTITAGGSVLAGSAANAISFVGAGTLINHGLVSGGTNYGVDGVDVTVTNYGTIDGAAAYTAGTGVYVGASGLLTNSGLVSGGSGLGNYGHGGRGLWLHGGTAAVFGTVAGGDAAASDNGTGGGGGLAALVTAGLLRLSGGLVVGGSGGYGGNYDGGIGGGALQVVGGGSLVGGGTIVGGAGGTAEERGGAGAAAIYVNQGFISGTGLVIDGGAGAAGDTGGQGGDGIDLKSASTLTGSITIAGGAGGSATNDNGGAGGIGLYLHSGSQATLNNDIIIGGAGGVSTNGTVGTAGIGLEDDSPDLLTGTGTITGGTGAVSRSRNTFGVGLLLGKNATANLDAIITGDTGAVGAEVYQANFVNSGVVQGGAGAVGVYVDDGRLTNAGTIIGTVAVYLVGSHNTLSVDPGAVFEGDVITSADNSNDLDLSGTTRGTLVGVGSSFKNFSIIDFGAGADWEITGNLSGFAGNNAPTIDGFTVGDQIVLDNEVATSDFFLNNKLTLTGAGGTIGTIALSASSIYDFTDSFALSSDGMNTTISLNCFAAGTRILTPRGEVPVEQIAVGDELITLRDPARPTAKVIWTGRRALDLARANGAQALWPVRIAAGAFDDGVPARDLRVSPHHAIYWDGNLFEAFSLINGVSIVQEPDCRFITYHHLEVEGHDVLLAEGLPAETYLETGGRDNFEGQVMRLHTDFRAPPDATFCAPLITDGPALTTLRAHLVARSGLRRAVS